MAREFDAALVDGAHAAEVVREAVAIENMAAALKAAAARRVADTHGYRQAGLHDGAEHLARVAGTSLHQARRALDTAGRLDGLPVLQAAVLAGRLSADKAAEVAGAAAAAPGAEEQLVALAQRRSLGEVKQECARVKAAADPDPEATHRRIHAGRSCRRRVTPEGAHEIAYRSTGEEVNEVWSVLSGFAQSQFRQARAEGRRDREELYAADGLLAMARAAATPSTPTSHPAGDADAGGADGDGAGGGGGGGAGRPVGAHKVIFRVDWPAWVRGHTIGGEICEASGIGPIPVSVARRMLAEGDPFIAAVITSGVDVVSVAHLGRRPTARQLTALQWAQTACSREGCNRSQRLEWDHREDWASTKRTPTRGLDGLCHRDHDLKTRHGWALVAGTGKRPMVPPDHPDHPRNKPPPP